MTRDEISKFLTEFIGKAPNRVTDGVFFIVKDSVFANTHNIKPYLDFLFSTKGYKSFNKKQKEFVYFNMVTITPYHQIIKTTDKRFDADFSFIYQDGFSLKRIVFFIQRMNWLEMEKAMELRDNAEPLVKIQRALLVDLKLVEIL